jgi:hypothetical protein
VDLAQILKQLWRLRAGVAVGVVVAVFAGIAAGHKVSLLPPSLESRSIEFGAASTQVLVDAEKSPLVDIARDIDPLSSRAAVYTRLVESAPVKREIAELSGVSPDTIVIATKSPATGVRTAQEPVAEERASELAGQGRAQRLLFEVEEDLPVIQISAQAPTGEAAITLANSAAAGLSRYINQLQVEQEVPPRRSIAVRQLGEASGGLVNGGANRMLALLIALVAMIAWCMLLLVGASIVRNWREESWGGPPRGIADFGEPEPLEPRLVETPLDHEMAFGRRGK